MDLFDKKKAFNMFNILTKLINSAILIDVSELKQPNDAEVLKRLPFFVIPKKYVSLQVKTVLNLEDLTSLLTVRTLKGKNESINQ